MVATFSTADPALRLKVEVLGFKLWGFDTWRFMGSYKWSYKSPNMGHNLVVVILILHIAPLINNNP